MKSMKSIAHVGFASAVIAGSLLGGCGKSESETAAKPPATKPATAPLVAAVAVVDWCKEHLMPESICVQCHPELADAFKAKHDWCATHGLPDSQCFKDHPELQAKFAADFKTKNGKEPPTDPK